MRKLLALLFVGIVVLASGCIGNQVGLTKEKVLNALQNIETAHYKDEFSIRMRFPDPKTNRTVNITVSGQLIGLFNTTAGLEEGNMSIKTHMMGFDIGMNWPYFINGSRAYFRVDGRWYNVSHANDLYSRIRASLNLNYINDLLKEKNVTIEKLSNGYAFRVNVTFWEFANATNQTGYLEKLWDVNGERIVNVTTKSGWVEVHFRDDGTPTSIETYMKLVITGKVLNGGKDALFMTVHEKVSLSEINKPVEIKAPKGIESAKDFEEIFE